MAVHLQLVFVYGLAQALLRLLDLLGELFIHVFVVVVGFGAKGVDPQLDHSQVLLLLHYLEWRQFLLLLLH